MPSPTRSSCAPTTCAIPIAWAPRRLPRFLSITPDPSPVLTEAFAQAPGAWLRAVMRTMWPVLTAAAILHTLTYLTAALLSPAVGSLVDSGLAHGLTSRLLPGLLTLVGLGLVASALAGATEVVGFASWANGWQPSARGVAHRLGLAPRAVTREVSAGDVVSAVTADADAIGEASYALGNAVGSLVSSVVIACLMIRMDPGLGLLVIVGVPAVLVLVAALVRPLDRRMSLQREEQGRLTTVTTDVVAGLRVLRGIGGEDVYAARYARQSARLRDAGIRVAATQALMSTIRMGAPMLLTASVVGLSATAVLDGRLSPGQFITFYGYLLHLAWPMEEVTYFMQLVTRAWVGARKVTRVAAVKPLVSDDAVPAAAASAPPAGDLVDLSTGVRLRGGAITALVCAVPAASAALAERLGRGDDAAGVTLGGTDLRHLPVAAVRQAVVVCGAHAEGFAGPLAGEVLGEQVPLAGARDLTELLGVYAGADSPQAAGSAVELTPAQRERAAHALWVAAADDVADSVGGLAGQLTEKARNLSGGQRQRLALARSLARRSQVLVLIEPTSALDSHTEDLVAQRVCHERRGMTTVVVTTSPLLLGRCDEVVLLEAPSQGEAAPPDGQAPRLREVARGTHHELSALAGYRAVVGRGGEQQ